RRVQSFVAGRGSFHGTSWARSGLQFLNAAGAAEQGRLFVVPVRSAAQAAIKAPFGSGRDSARPRETGGPLARAPVVTGRRPGALSSYWFVVFRLAASLRRARAQRPRSPEARG